MAGGDKYLRFVIYAIDENSLVEQGIFAAMGMLEENNVLYPYEEKLQKELSKWFGKNLVVPGVIRNKYGSVTPKAISWFKDSAQKHISKMRSYAQILENHEYRVKQIKTDRPGKIIYEDDHQISAIPFKDTFNKQ
ncbi:MAG: hypothetical protein HOH19_08005 [Kordiimonadaceae bacterium]|nr:hypothetical protein [Kordiimonadaceae bacterium]MBT6032504.1 hypothetical protein [Kordiimonadaceae bacterium]